MNTRTLYKCFQLLVLPFLAAAAGCSSGGDQHVPKVVPPLEGVSGGTPVEGQHWISPSTGMEFVWVEEMKLWVGRFEVTNEEFSKYKLHDSGDYQGTPLNEPRQPVVKVNFRDAKAYAESLTGGDGLAGYKYALPTESEWTALAECGSMKLVYPWGNRWPPEEGNAGNYDQKEISGYTDPFKVSCAVEDSWENPWGLFGVGGNVWECTTRDGSRGFYFGSWRGASWQFGNQESLRSDYRLDYAGTEGNYRSGFRLLLHPPAPIADEEEEGS